MNGFPELGFNQIIRPGGLFFFRFLRFMPYIASILLISAVIIWVIFGIKKSRWAKILAIVLTVLVVITSLCSLGNLLIGRFKGETPREFPQNREKFRRFEERVNPETERSINKIIFNGIKN